MLFSGVAYVWSGRARRCQYQQNSPSLLHHLLPTNIVSGQQTASFEAGEEQTKESYLKGFYAKSKKATTCHDVRKQCGEQEQP